MPIITKNTAQVGTDSNQNFVSESSENFERWVSDGMFVSELLKQHVTEAKFDAVSKANFEKIIEITEVVEDGEVRCPVDLQDGLSYLARKMLLPPYQHQREDIGVSLVTSHQTKAKKVSDIKPSWLIKGSVLILKQT